MGEQEPHKFLVDGIETLLPNQCLKVSEPSKITKS